MISIRILPSLETAARHAAKIIHDSLTAHTEQRRSILALSGGTTPRAIYGELRRLPDIKQLLNDRAEIFFSDERSVPPDDLQSNYGLARDLLFEPLGVPPERVHRMRGEADDLQREALRYAQEIRAVTGAGSDPMPSLDLIMLGMGADGHTASLFPGGSWTGSADAIVVTFAPDRRISRLSMNVDLLNQSRSVVFVVTGTEKAPAAKKVLSADVAIDILPARLIDARRTLWILDSAAAADLDRTHLRGTLETC